MKTIIILSIATITSLALGHTAVALFLALALGVVVVDLLWQRSSARHDARRRNPRK